MQNTELKQPDRSAFSESNKLYAKDSAAHDWYRFVLSFPPHLVREYVQRFEVGGTQRVLDPFCGTGTTLVECKKLGVASVGIEANPFAHFACCVKTDWEVDPHALLAHAKQIATLADQELEAAGVADEILPLFSGGNKQIEQLRVLPHEVQKLLLTNSISALPLHKTLVLLDCLRRQADEGFSKHERLALAKALVFSISNLSFGPEVGVGPAKNDASVVSAWLSGVQQMADDLQELHSLTGADALVHQADARQLNQIVEPKSIDAVITSPPYPNEKDYTRTTRLESVLLGFINSKEELRTLKRALIRSNTRNVYKNDDDDQWAIQYPEVQRIAEAIEARRIELGKTSGFERLYARVTRLYFGGMARHLAELRTALRPGAKLAYVVGDQASYLRVLIRTGQIIADIAQTLGYELIGIDLFRTRLATVTKERLREEVVVLRWPG